MIKKVNFNATKARFLISQFFKDFVCRMVFIGAILKLTCDCVFDLCLKFNFGNEVLRYYIRVDEGVTETDAYTVSQLIYWLGEPIIYIFIFTALTKCTEKIILSKIVWRWFIDFQVLDIGFLIFSTPYVFNRSKWISVGLTTLFFLIHTGLVIVRKKMIALPKK